MLVEFQDATNSLSQINSLNDLNLCLYDARKFNDIQTYHNLLSNEEKERASKFIRSQDAKVYILTHAFLRLKLSRILKLEPAGIHFEKNNFGKPLIPNSNFDFNISHSRNFFSIIVGRKEGFKVGVDIEDHKSVAQLNGVIQSYMHPAERADITAHNEHFFKYWTRKEALLKVLGRGLVNNLHEINTCNGIREITIDKSQLSPCEKIVIQSFNTDDLTLSFAVYKSVE